MVGAGESAAAPEWAPRPTRLTAAAPPRLDLHDAIFDADASSACRLGHAAPLQPPRRIAAGVVPSRCRSARFSADCSE